MTGQHVSADAVKEKAIDATCEENGVKRRDCLVCSEFETATEFWNPQALITSNMLIWGFSEPTRLKGKPCVTVHAD